LSSTAGDQLRGSQFVEHRSKARRGYPDDNGAIESVKQFVNGHEIELWQRDRIIAKFDPEPDGP
jgi:hypothetical protein